MKNLYPIIILLVLFNFETYGQNTGIGLWPLFEIEKGFNENLELDIRLSNRLEDNLMKRDKSFAGLNLSYLINDFTTRIGYRFENIKEALDDNVNSHRFIWQLEYLPDWKRFTFGLRTRFQTQYFGKDNDGIDHHFQNYSRNRFEISYKIKNTKLKPLTSLEYFYIINTNGASKFEKRRFILGMGYSINAVNSIKISYILFETLDKNDPFHNHILGLYYKFII